MKIAMVSPLYEPVPPKLYGGTERVVASLANALFWRGHEVTLFASGDSRIDCELHACRDRAIRLDPRLCSDMAAHLLMLKTVRKQAARFDIIHFHTDSIQFPLFEDIANKTLTTLHGRLDIVDLPDLYNAYSAFPLVSISDSQRRPMQSANWWATVHHGYPKDMFRFSATPNGDCRGPYLAFLGRISPEKGPERAIEIARKAGIRLKIAAKVDDADRAYFHEQIEPLLHDPLVEYVGEIDDDRKSEFLGNALALVFPIMWPEPFGLVMIEAMACGTPVIAYDCGSVREVVEPGLTGFVVDCVEEAAEAAGRAVDFDRRAIRKVFDDRFSSDTMAMQYENLYQRILTRQHSALAGLALSAQRGSGGHGTQIAPLSVAASASRTGDRIGRK
jgi:glycosyltransferase involved in cell wall biosynthesis